MRSALPALSALLATILAAGCLAPAPQDSTGLPTGATPTATARALGDPTTFLPEWREGGEIVWDVGGSLANATVPPGWRWASDGKTYLYATFEPTARTEEAVERCGPTPPEDGAWVLVNVTACNWERHPTVACDLPATERGPCDVAWSHAPPGGNVYRPYWRSGPANVTWVDHGGRQVDVRIPADASWASDLHTYFYAARAPASQGPDAAAACVPDQDANAAMMVVIDAEPCFVSAHPSISCGGWMRGEDPCSFIVGPGPSGPTPTG